MYKTSAPNESDAAQTKAFVDLTRHGSVKGVVGILEARAQVLLGDLIGAHVRIILAQGKGCSCTSMMNHINLFCALLKGVLTKSML